MMNRIYCIALGLGLSLSGAAGAQNLVKNGDFETVTNKAGAVVAAGAGAYQITIDSATVGNSVQNWSNTSSFGVVYEPGYADNANSFNLTLYGPDNGKANGLTATSPQGGNFFAVDSNYLNGSFTQVISGMTVGQAYSLSFWWAGGELTRGGGGTLSTGWRVKLAGDGKTDIATTTFSRPVPSQGFIPWQQEVINFIATTSSETLSFTLTGTGSPPMSLLDGVAIVAVPEPASGMLLAGGAMMLVLAQRRRGKQSRG